MAIADFYYPFDSIDGDRPVTAAVERRFWGALFNDGVVGYDGFALTAVSKDVYNLGPGVGIVGGMVGGIKSGMRLVLANPTAGTTYYVVMRASTYSSVRNVAFTASATTIYSADADQLDESGMRDLVLYRIDVDASGNQTVTDMRTYCTSFDAAQWAGKVAEAIEGISVDAAAALDGVQSQLDAATTAINAETAGLYGSAGRQGFMNPLFLVNQRGGSAWSFMVGRNYVTDRWCAEIEGQTSSTVFATVAQEGARRALSIRFRGFATGTTAQSVALWQNIEGGVRTFCAGGKQFTVSFDARATVAHRVAVDAVQIAEAGGTGAAIAPQVVNVSTSWSRYSLTFTGTQDLTAAQVADVLKVRFFTAWEGRSELGTDNTEEATVYFANMQINEGTQALSCYARPYGEELDACQRFYCTYGPVSMMCSASTSNVLTVPLAMPRSMYRVPDVLTEDRDDLPNRASVELAAGGWRHGLRWTPLVGEGVPALLVANTDGAAVARVCFEYVALDAEITD